MTAVHGHGGLSNSRNFLTALVFGILMAVVSTLPVSASPDQWKRAGFTTDFSKHTVPFSDILSGGPPKDGIPSIDKPYFQKAEDIDWLEDDEPVIHLELDGVARAYPLQILIWHEIVNDVIGARPVSVTYCPLCNSSIVFDRRHDGAVLDFGTTGLLRNSDLVMYDRQSETWWQQFTGEGIVGTHAGKSLKMLPSRVVPFSNFKKRHPDANVLARPNPATRPYGRNPYEGYDSRSAPYPLFQGELPEHINPMERVVVINAPDGRYAATLSHIREVGSLKLSETALIRWSGEQASILDARSTKDGRGIGAVEAVTLSGGTEQPLVHDVTFAFVVHAFYPDLPILGVNQP
ncbi:DUF3179 domain-containing protein [Labrenzia sp. PHM005]|uniref:DUF3179 domain-containing protein n=1 Tax=Labrenzia sp. PHM005 TaxID=2590016 RepID=UPI0011404AE5|nr:DUF3179 domain-containing protein [Labrenzia sp. PHM005]QDG79021.1 DUF3179 domain-containing protein [Labrenzia sp. PHM005]